MTIRKAFINWMVANSLGTFGVDIFAGQAPLDTPNKCFWVMNDGGGSVLKASTGEKMKNYQLSVYYRNTDAEDVDEVMQDLEELLNSKMCHELPPYNSIEFEATVFPSDQDLDNEERTIGLLQVTLTVYSNN